MNRTVPAVLLAVALAAGMAPVHAVTPPGAPPVTATITATAWRSNNTPGCVTRTEWARIRRLMADQGRVTPNQVARITAAPLRVDRSIRKRGAWAIDQTSYRACNRTTRLRVEWEWLAPSGWRLRSGGPFPPPPPTIRT